MANIRSSALSWLRSKYPLDNQKVFASKFFTPDESWSKSSVWFFQIPVKILDPKNGFQFIHLLGENDLKDKPFIYFKVPVAFIVKNLELFDLGKQQKHVRIYLSAEAANRYLEIRKGSNLAFSEFVQL